MKSKGGSLYEVLKSASRAPGGADPGAPAPDTTPVTDGNQSTLQERLAAYKAAKLAAATQATPEPPKPEAAVATAKVSATTLVLDPDPTPLPAPTPARIERPAPATVTVVAPAPAPLPVQDEDDSSADVPAGPGPGERVFKLTYNSALFGGMVVVGLLFIAYAVGLHLGKASVISAEVAGPVPIPPRPAAPTPAPVPPPAPRPTPIPAPPTVRKEYTIRLCDLKYATAQDRMKALAFAEDADLKKALERAGRKGYEKATVKLNGETRMALYVDHFSDINSDAAKAALTAMKTFRFKGQTPFSGATFEEAQPR